MTKQNQVRNSRALKSRGQESLNYLVYKTQTEGKNPYFYQPQAWETC